MLEIACNANIVLFLTEFAKTSFKGLELYKVVGKEVVAKRTFYQETQKLLGLFSAQIPPNNRAPLWDSHC